MQRYVSKKIAAEYGKKMLADVERTNRASLHFKSCISHLFLPAGLCDTVPFRVSLSTEEENEAAFDVAVQGDVRSDLKAIMRCRVK